MTQKVWFITGASRGFGREWTIAALDRGDSVAATARDTSTLDELGSAEARDHVHQNARRIANSLLNGILIQREGGLGLRADQELA